MSQDEFTKLFRYMTDRFDALDRQFEAQNGQFDKLESLIDQVLRQQDISDEERLVMGHQLDRLDRWVHELADKIGHELTAGVGAAPEYRKPSIRMVASAGTRGLCLHKVAERSTSNADTLNKRFTAAEIAR